MQIKTNELTGAALDWAVCMALGRTDMRIDPDDGDMVAQDVFDYTTDWAQGGPIIEREKIGVWWATHYVDDEGVEYGNHWYAEMGCTDDNADKPYDVFTGPTPLIAAMRCFVASKLGDEVDVPKELCK